MVKVHKPSDYETHSCIVYSIWLTPYHRGLVSFPRAVSAVTFVLDKMALGQVNIPVILVSLINYKLNWTPWPESASELYRPSDRRLSAKLVPHQILRHLSSVNWYNGSSAAQEPMNSMSPYKNKTNSVAWVRERIIPTERPLLIGTVSANFCGKKVPSGQPDGSLRPHSRLFRPEPLYFLLRSSSFVFTRLSGPRSRPTTSQNIW
jgi:hypothetical protein